MKKYSKYLMTVLAVAMLAVLVSLSSGMTLADTTVVVVTGENVGVDWFSPDIRGGGHVAFVQGPSTPPFGLGSLEMGTTAGVDKAQLFNYDHIGTLLADIDAITYATYRYGSSTNSAVQYPAINIEVDYAGDGISFSTLVWEPTYAYGAGSLAVDTWQIWDTFGTPTTSFGGGWWSTRDIPGVCAFNCFVDWNTIITNNPGAKIKGAVGINVGSGWNGVFLGNADALTLSVSGDIVTYDFEPFRVPQTKDDCKNGGWQNLRRADGTPFKNQGDCIQYVNTGK